MYSPVAIILPSKTHQLPLCSIKSKLHLCTPNAPVCTDDPAMWLPRPGPRSDTIIMIDWNIFCHCCQIKPEMESHATIGQLPDLQQHFPVSGCWTSFLKPLSWKSWQTWSYREYWKKLNSFVLPDLLSVSGIYIAITLTFLPFTFSLNKYTASAVCFCGGTVISFSSGDIYGYPQDAQDTLCTLGAPNSYSLGIQAFHHPPKPVQAMKCRIHYFT